MMSLLFWYLTTVISTAQKNQFIRLLFSASKPPNRPNRDDDDDNDDQCVVCFSTLGRVDRVDVQATGRGQFVPYTRLDQDQPSQTILFERPLKV